MFESHLNELIKQTVPIHFTSPIILCDWVQENNFTSWCHLMQGTSWGSFHLIGKRDLFQRGSVLQPLAAGRETLLSNIISATFLYINHFRRLSLPDIYSAKLRITSKSFSLKTIAQPQGRVLPSEWRSLNTTGQNSNASVSVVLE